MRRSPRNLRIACDHRGLTHFGGVYFFHEFLQLLQLRDFLARHLSYPRRNHRYSLSQMILALVYPLVLGLDRLETARLVGWAANSANLEADRASAIQSGLLLGPVLSGDRLRADGTRLSWRLTNLRSVAFDGVAPFLIDWGESRHPASTAAHGATLISLCAEHPAAETVRVRLAACGLPLPVTECPMPALIATIDCPNGRVEIR